MGRRKIGKPKRERQHLRAVARNPWGEPLVPHPSTGRFELADTAPPETIEFFRQVEELVPLYGGSVPESATVLDEVLRRGTQLGVLNASGRAGGLVSVAEFAQRVGVGVEELRWHAHHLHASGALGVTPEGLLRINVPAGPRAHGEFSH